MICCASDGLLWEHTHTHTVACDNFLSAITFSIFYYLYTEAHLMYAQASIYMLLTHALCVENYKAQD